MVNVKANMEIRKKIIEKGLFYYQIAKRLGVSDITFSRWMREELSEARKQRILEILEEYGDE